MIFSRAPHAVGEAKSLCRLLAWKALPRARRVVLIAVRLADSKFVERGGWFPFFKRGSMLPQDEEIRRMPRRGFAPRASLVVELDTSRLIVHFQHIRVILHCVETPQLHMLAF